MNRKQYDLNFKLNIIQKGKEIGNYTAVARQHELDPKMVLRWAKQLDRRDVDKLDCLPHRANLRSKAFGSNHTGSTHEAPAL